MYSVLYYLARLSMLRELDILHERTDLSPMEHVNEQLLANFSGTKSATMSISKQLSRSSVHVVLHCNVITLQNTGTRQGLSVWSKWVQALSVFFDPAYETTYSARHVIHASRTL